MRGAIAISAVLHVSIIVIAYFGVPELSDGAEVTSVPIPVELVMIAEVTTPPPPKVKPEPAEAEPEAQVTAPPPAEVEVPAVAPRPIEEEPEEAPEPTPLPKEKPEVVEPAPEPKPKPVAKRLAPAPRHKPERHPDFDPDRIAALLNKDQDEPPPPRIEPEEEPAPPETEEPAPDLAARVRDMLSISPVDDIRRQFRSCWSFPGGARAPEDLIVKVRIRLKPDGDLIGEPRVVETGRLGDPFFRAAAEAAVRAVHKCTPLKRLPQLDYNEWNEIELTFDPREMVGG